MTPLAIGGGLLLGVVIGVISGMIGIGGGAFLIPFLIFFYGMSQKTAQGKKSATCPRSVPGLLTSQRAGAACIEERAVRMRPCANAKSQPVPCFTSSARQQLHMGDCLWSRPTLRLSHSACRAPRGPFQGAAGWGRAL